MFREKAKSGNLDVDSSSFDVPCAPLSAINLIRGEHDIYLYASSRALSSIPILTLFTYSVSHILIQCPFDKVNYCGMQFILLLWPWDS